MAELVVWAATTAVTAAPTVGAVAGTVATVNSLDGANDPEKARRPPSREDAAAAAAKERRRRAGQTGRRSTILTGPRGLLGGQPSGLGSPAQPQPTLLA